MFRSFALAGVAGLLLFVLPGVAEATPCTMPIDTFVERADGTPFSGVVNATVMLYRGADRDDPTACASRAFRVEDGRGTIGIDVCSPTAVSGCPTTPVREAIDAMHRAGSEVGVDVFIDGELAATTTLGYVPAPAPDWVPHAGEAERADVCTFADAATLADDADRFGGRGPSSYVLAPDGTCDEGEFLVGFDHTGALTCEAPPTGSTGEVQAPIRASCGPEAAVVSISPDGSYACAPFGVADDRFQQPTSVSCPPGSALVSIQADGTGTCAPSGTDLSGLQLATDITCPEGTSIVAVRPDGTATCDRVVDVSTLQVATSVSCADGMAVTAIWPDGSAECRPVAGSGVETGTCPGGEYMSGFAADGSLACTRLPASDGLQVLTAENMGTFTAEEYRPVFVAGTILVEGVRYDALDEEGVHVFGGHFEGIGGLSEVDFGDRAVITGARFDDVIIDGSDVTFVNCEFYGEIEFPFDAVVREGHLEADVSSVTRIGLLDGVEIRNATLRRVTRIANSYIRDSVLGDADANHNISFLLGNDINDTTVELTSDATVTGNHFDDSYLFLNGARGLISITANRFGDMLDGRTEQIRIVPDDSWYHAIRVSENVFESDTDTSRKIYVTGNTSGRYQVVSIDNNTFIKGASAIAASTNVPLLVRNNVLHSTSLGVSGGSGRVVRDNDEID